MGLRHNLEHQISILSGRVGGSYGTRSARKMHGRHFVMWYLENIQKIRKLTDVAPAVLPKYVEHLKEKKLKPGSVQTYLGSVRVLLRAAGVNLKGYEDNRSMGASIRSRAGTKLPYPDCDFDDLLGRARDIDLGMFHVLRLERLLGIRGLEALMSTASIARWIDEVQYLLAVHITDGSKGGRPRYTDVLKAKVSQTKEVLLDALEYLQHHKYFVTTKGGGLHSARQRYHRLARQLGLVGEYSPHSLRYAWACEKARELIEAGLSRKEILTFLSQCLGHGDSRGRWVKQVYAASVVHLLPPPTRIARRLYEFAIKLDSKP